MYLYDCMIEADLKVAATIIEQIESPADIWTCEKALYSALLTLCKAVGSDIVDKDTILTKISHYDTTLQGIDVDLLEVPVQTLKEQIDYLKNYIHKEV